MNGWKRAGLSAALLFAGATAGSPQASAQSRFQTYHCADGTQFVVGFFQYDSRAHLQLDGHAVTLKKRLALSGARYTGGGVALRITRTGVTTLKHARQPVTTCEPT